MLHVHQLVSTRNVAGRIGSLAQRPILTGILEIASSGDFPISPPMVHLRDAKYSDCCIPCLFQQDIVLDPGMFGVHVFLSNWHYYGNLPLLLQCPR